MAFAGSIAPPENEPVSFPNWQAVLMAAPLASEAKAKISADVMAFLADCKARRGPASIASVRAFLGECPECREALRWWWKAARSQLLQSPAEPFARSSRALPAAALADQGGADWERDLIAAARRKGFLWRTERTYRDWGRRFAEFLQPRSPYAATGEDLAGFLSALAVRQRASASTQKQALNALVFLMEEALRRAVGELEFRRS